MLTVKHIIWDGDFETIYEASEVRVCYHSPQEGFTRAPNAPKLPIKFVAFDKPNGDCMTLTFGRIYVVNELGKTVASYHVEGVDAPEPVLADRYATNLTASEVGQSINLTASEAGRGKFIGRAGDQVVR